MNERARYLESISKRGTIDTTDVDFIAYTRNGSSAALRRYTDRVNKRIAIKEKRLDRDARFDAVVLLANRDDFPRNVWWTHRDIVDFVENDAHPERVEPAVHGIIQENQPNARMKDLLNTLLSERGLAIREDSQLCWSFISGLSQDPPDKVVAIAQLTAYLWMNGRQAWQKHRIRAENEVARLFERGEAYTWTECVQIAIKRHGFIFN